MPHRTSSSSMGRPPAATTTPTARDVPSALVCDSFPRRCYHHSSMSGPITTASFDPTPRCCDAATIEQRRPRSRRRTVTSWNQSCAWPKNLRGWVEVVVVTAASCVVIAPRLISRHSLTSMSTVSRRRETCSTAKLLETVDAYTTVRSSVAPYQHSVSTAGRIRSSSTFVSSIKRNFELPQPSTSGTSGECAWSALHAQALLSDTTKRLSQGSLLDSRIVTHEESFRESIYAVPSIAHQIHSEQRRQLLLRYQGIDTSSLGTTRTAVAIERAMKRAAVTRTAAVTSNSPSFSRTEKQREAPALHRQRWSTPSSATPLMAALSMDVDVEQQNLPPRRPPIESNENETRRPSARKKKIKVRSIVPSATTTRALTGASSNNKVPTMPGFSAMSDKERSFHEGVRRVERQTGKSLSNIVYSKEANKKRRQLNGEAMYKNSACVPESLVQFATEIHRENRITSTEEKELGTKTQEAIKLQFVYDDLMKSLNREPTDEEWCAAAGKINMQMIQQTIDEGLDAKNKLVVSNLRMVQSVVNTYIRNGLTAEYNAGDMMQDGILGLIRAAEKFSPDRGFAFSTYALYWIRAAIKRSQIFQSRVITIPPRMFENHKRLQRVESELSAALDRKPTLEELGAAVGMSVLQIKRCRVAMSNRCLSLDAPVVNRMKPLLNNGSRETLLDLVDKRSSGVSNDEEGIQLDPLDYGFLREDIIETLHRYLLPQEVELLLLRYGLKDCPSHKIGGTPTIAELSEMLGEKPDKIRRTINKALHDLKRIGVEEWYAFDRDL